MNYEPLNRCVRVLIESGIRHVCIGAGSRSTAIVQAFRAYLGITIHPFFDERSVGFRALGLAKALNQSVAIVTTSGTAVSNLCPSVTEAVKSGHPLVVITADRPERYRLTSANQTIDQRGIFNDATDCLTLPETHDGLADFEWGVRQACHRQTHRGGVIHINAPLEDPVGHPYTAPEDVTHGLLDGASTIEPFLGDDEGDGVRDLSAVMTAIDRHPTNAFVLCIGQIEPFADPDDITALVTHFGWPTIVDGTNHALKTLPMVIQCSDDGVGLLRECANSPFILYVGGAWVSKAMATYLEQHRERVVHVSMAFPAVYPHATSVRVSGYGELMSCQVPVSALHGVTATNEQTMRRLLGLVATHDEYAVIHQLLGSVDGDTLDVFIGNSLSIRYVDAMRLARVRRLHVNRGASGIDGNVSTVAGLCAVDDAVPLLAIMGDLTALYDLNAWLMLHDVNRPFTVVIINNGGGGIFDRLPVSRDYAHYDHDIRLTHNREVGPILSAMGLTVHRVTEATAIKPTYTSEVIEFLLLRPERSTHALDSEIGS